MEPEYPSAGAAEPSSSIYNYLVTAHKPTAVLKTLVGNFTGATDLNLIIGKSTRIEIFTTSTTGLQGVLDVPLYGRISAMELFRPKGYSKDLLFVLVERLKFCVLEFDAETGELVTRAQGDAKDKVGRPAENGQLAVIDPECRMIGMHLYDGLLKVVPMDEAGRLSEAFNVRMEELLVIDTVLLHGCDKPTLAVLYEDTKHARHLKTYEVNLREKDFTEGPISQQNLDLGASLLIPVPKPLGGVVVVGESVITYLSPGSRPCSVGIKSTIIKAVGKVDEDGTRYLMSDHYGLLYLLVLAHDGQRVAGLKVEVVGRTSSASSLSYIDNGVVYVGSRQGDSQLVRLHPEPVNPTEPNNYVEVIESFPNLGPIVDFCVMDLERQGQGQVVTCSGTLTDGSLRIIRNGIGINEQATVELAGIKGVWSLRPTTMDVHDKYLVMTFVGETRLLAINADDELDEAEIPGFEGGAQTLWCGNVAHDQMVQVTSAGVRLVDAHSQQLAAEWKPPAGSAVNVASGSLTQVVVATGGGRLVQLEVGEGALVEVGAAELGVEVACVDVSPVAESERSPLIAVGTWSLELMLLAAAPAGGSGSGAPPAALATVAKEELGGEIIPRSVLMASFEGLPYCLCGLGDGQLLTWRMDASTGALSERKRVLLGTKPIQLRAFRSNGTASVFAASDRPTVIYSSNKKLVYSNLNENEVNFIASFNSSSFPDCLAIAKEGALTIGTIDDIQKLHIRSVPLHEQPRRIVHQESTKSLGVLTVANLGMDDEAFHLRILDDQAFDVITSFALDPFEMGCSIASMRLGEDPAMYYVVGTAYARPEEPEPTRGRLLVMQLEEGKLNLVAEKEVRGAVHEVVPFQGKLLSSCNNKVHLHRWVQREDGSRDLQLECSHMGHVISLYLAARGDFILVGDLMRSVSLLVYKGEEGVMEQRAQDFNSVWTTAVAMLDDDTYIAAENSYNLYVVRKNGDAATDEERGRLEVVGEVHVGEFVNRLRPGSLVMRLPDSETSNIPTLLFGTIDGVVGVMASLPRSLFEFMSKLQDALRQVVKGVGGLDHAEWRSFCNESKQVEARGFVDGDLVEMFLDLKAEQQQQVVSLMAGGATVEEVTKRVEEMTRLH